MSNLTIAPTEAQGGAWAETPAGIYDADITSIEDDGVSAAYPDDGPRYKWFFALPGMLDEENKPVVLHGWCSQKLNPKSKLWKWLTQLGFPLVPGGPAFDLGQVVRHQCTIVVSVSDTANGPRPKVTDVMPPRGGQRAPAPSAPVQQQAPIGDDAALCSTCGQVADYATSKGITYCAQHGPRAEL